MVFKQLQKSYWKLRRTREIAATFFKYRLGNLFFPRLGTTLMMDDVAEADQVGSMSVARRFRLALQELGPTFIKFGQLLSTRPDLVPRDFVDELSLLQDSAWESRFFDIGSVLESEWGHRADGYFKSFDLEPIAVASLSQVHRGVLISGESVAVKIQKPSIEDVITLDIEVLYEVAKFWKKHSSTGWVYQPELMVDEFARAIRNELDFFKEAQNYERFRNNFRDDETVRFPKVYWELTTPRVLTMEFIEGVKITDIVKPQWEGKFDPELVVKRGLRITLKQIFEDGFFHADVHPANILVLPGNTIVQLDVGMVGWLDEATRRSAMKMFHGLMAKDAPSVIRAFEELGMRKAEVNGESLPLDIREFSSRYNSFQLKHLQFGTMASDLIEILVRHRMVIPRSLVLVIKSFSTIEFIGQQLDPEFNMFHHAQPFLARLLIKRFSPSEWWEKAENFFYEAFDMITAFPQEVASLLEKLREGKIKFIYEHKGLDQLTHTLENTATRLSFSIIIASFLLSWALIIKNQDIASFLGSLGILGFIIALVWAGWLVVNIFRSRK